MGEELFHLVCQRDLEGVVAKRKFDPYLPSASWLKIRNLNYSQWLGREELFERERHKEPVAGWHSCALACAALMYLHRSFVTADGANRRRTLALSRVSPTSRVATIQAVRFAFK